MMSSNFLQYISGADVVGISALILYTFKQISSFQKKIKHLECRDGVEEVNVNNNKISNFSQGLIIFLGMLLFVCCGYFISQLDKPTLIDICKISDSSMLIFFIFTPIFFSFLFQMKRSIVTYLSFFFMAIMFIVYNVFHFDVTYPELTYIGWNVSIFFMAVVLFCNSIEQ
jgi:hypothetical protein